MFRKITSDRDPGATIGAELKKEFGKYLRPLADRCKAFLARCPRSSLAAMIICMLVSGILAFTVLRVRGTVPLAGTPPAAQPLTDGLAQVIRTGQALQQVLRLRGSIDTLLQKHTLGRADSLRLRQAFKQLDSIQLQIHHR